jgi:hypothetical protein
VMAALVAFYDENPVLPGSDMDYFVLLMLVLATAIDAVADLRRFPTTVSHLCELENSS